MKLEAGKSYKKLIGYDFGARFDCVAVRHGQAVGFLGNQADYFNEEVGEGSFEEWKEPQRGECWVNIDADGYFDAWKSREVADRQKNPDRIACVKVEWTEGQGLEGEAR